jgi:hypothetical protein
MIRVDQNEDFPLAVRRFWVDKNFDTKTGVSATIPEIEEYIRQEEIKEACSRIGKGEPISISEYATELEIKEAVGKRKEEYEQEALDTNVKIIRLGG